VATNQLAWLACLTCSTFCQLTEAESGGFAAPLSGTENTHKIYTKSFIGGATMKRPANNGNNATSMKALVYHGPGIRAWEDRPKPTIMEATDAIVRITTTTLCGTDLHILKGDVYQPVCAPTGDG
jgi:hypothetical protein